MNHKLRTAGRFTALAALVAAVALGGVAPVVASSPATVQITLGLAAVNATWSVGQFPGQVQTGLIKVTDGTGAGLSGVPVTLRLARGYFMAPAGSAHPSNVTYDTDSTGSLSFAVSIGANKGFADDGKVDAELDASASGLNASVVVHWTTRWSPRSSSSCPNVIYIGARGSGQAAKDHQGFGREVYSMFRQGLLPGAVAKGLSIAAEPVTTFGKDRYTADGVKDLYPSVREAEAMATALRLLGPGALVGIGVGAAAEWKIRHLDRFSRSIDAGMRVTTKLVRQASAACPSAQLVLAGYSQGAIAVHDALNELKKTTPAVLNRIPATLLLADGDRVRNSKAIRFGSASKGATGIRRYWHVVRSHDVPRPRATAEICDHHDVVCDFSAWTIRLNWGAGGKIHTTYPGRDPKALTNATTWAVRRLSVPMLALGRLTALSSAPAPGALAGLVTLSVVSTDGHPIAGVDLESEGGHVGVTDQNGRVVTWQPSGTTEDYWANTTSSTAYEPGLHDQRTTVVMAEGGCFDWQDTGTTLHLQVGDTETWGNEDSSGDVTLPLTSSALASYTGVIKYGDSATSAIALNGGPYSHTYGRAGSYDVHIVGSGTGANGGTCAEDVVYHVVVAAPPPATYAETTGTVTHTWTNYSNAGGTQGQTIGANHTVQISCVVQGFKVSDGNTNWYRIASSPWNGSYYASADAFYNNGQTSGSLQGLPFVDPKVPRC